MKPEKRPLHEARLQLLFRSTLRVVDGRLRLSASRRLHEASQLAVRKSRGLLAG